MKLDAFFQVGDKVWINERRLQPAVITRIRAGTFSWWTIEWAGQYGKGVIHHLSDDLRSAHERIGHRFEPGDQFCIYRFDASSCDTDDLENIKDSGTEVKTFSCTFLRAFSPNCVLALLPLLRRDIPSTPSAPVYCDCGGWSVGAHSHWCSNPTDNAKRKKGLRI
jgi:hypothetical protein